jgi:hypothetical protein
LSEITESPGETKPVISYRVALGAVIGVGVLMLIMIVLIVVGISQGWGKAPAQTPAQTAAANAAKKPVTMTLEPGFRILSSDTQPGRLILHVRSETVDEIFVIDTDDGHIVALVHGDAPKGP